MFYEVEDLYYLSSSFNPASITVPQLRNILSRHDVGYPSSAKKPKLIELFNENIVPQAMKLLADNLVEPSEEGITNASLSQVLTLSDDEDALEEPQPKPKRKQGELGDNATPISIGCASSPDRRTKYARRHLDRTRIMSKASKSPATPTSKGLLS